MSQEQEIELTGGNVTQVVRVGETVRRPSGPWTPAVHALLRHLGSKGFSGAPRVLGLDPQGREILSFIPGDVGHEPLLPYMRSADTLQAVARLIRRFHDATLDFVPPPDAVWRLPYPGPAPCDVVCHNDLAPYNTVFQEGMPVAFIDWDWASPGPRVWDLAAAAYRFVPISYAEDVLAAGRGDPAWQARRLRLFCQAYGYPEPLGVLDAVLPRLELMCSTIKDQASAGNEAFQKQLAEGHLAFYLREIEAISSQMPALRSALNA